MESRTSLRPAFFCKKVCKTFFYVNYFSYISSITKRSKQIMNYLVNPQDLVFKAKSRIVGFNEMVRDEEIPQWDLFETAMEIVEEWTNDWPEDQGFGSSDGTYMLKEFIDMVIGNYTNSGKYMTKFAPSLSVVPYSEEEHHNKVQQMES